MAQSLTKKHQFFCNLQEINSTRRFESPPRAWDPQSSPILAKTVTLTLGPSPRDPPPSPFARLPRFLLARPFLDQIAPNFQQILQLYDSFKFYSRHHVFLLGSLKPALVCRPFCSPSDTHIHTVKTTLPPLSRLIFDTFTPNLF